MYHNIILIVQIVSAIFLSLFILVQSKGSGLSATFGGSSTFYSAKRGPEKFLFYATIVLAVIFFATTFSLAFI